MISNILNIPVCSLNNWQLFLGLFIPFLLGFLLKYFLDRKYQSIYEELEKTKMNLRQSESRNFTIRTELEAALAEQKNNKAADISGFQSRISELESQNSGLKTSLEKAHADLLPFAGVDLASLQSKLADSEHSKFELNTEIQALLSHKTHLEDKISSFAQVQDQIASIKAEHEKLKSDYDQVLLEKEHLRAESEKSKLAQEEIGGGMGALSQEVENWKKEAEKSKLDHAQALENWQNEINSLRSKHHEEFENLKNEAQSIISSHAGEIENWKKQAEEARLESQNLNEKLGGSSSREDQLNQELSNIQEKLTQAQKDLDYFNSAHPSLMNETEALRHEIASASAETQEAKNRILELENELGQHKQSLMGLHESLQGHIESLKSENDHKTQLLEELHDLKTKIFDLESENLALKSLPIQHAESVQENPTPEPDHEEHLQGIENPELDPWKELDHNTENHTGVEHPESLIATEHSIESDPSSHMEAIHAIQPESLESIDHPTLVNSENSAQSSEDFETHTEDLSVNPESHGTVDSSVEHASKSLDWEALDSDHPSADSSHLNQVLNQESGVRNKNIYQDPNYFFRLRGYPNAKEVHLVGDFENWDQNQYLMHWNGEEWIFPIHLEPGKYLYKFIVDGEWILDPAHSHREQNIFGTGNSVVNIE